MENRPRLLVVDPSKPVRQMVRLAAAKILPDTLEAETVEQALALIRECRPEVVLTELYLPDGSAGDVLTEAKAHNADCVVVAMTAEDDVGQAVQLIREGAFTVTTKPISRRDLAVGLERALQQHCVLLEARQVQEMKRKLQEELEFRVDEQTRIISSLLEFSNELNALEEFNRGIELIKHVISGTLGCQRVTILLRDDSGEQFTVVGPRDEANWGSSEIESNPDLVHKAVESRQVVQAPPQHGFTESETSGLLTVPLTHRSGGNGPEVFGVINISDKKGAAGFDESDLRIVRSIADVASVAMSNLRNKQRLESSYFDTVGALARALEAKDRYTHGHSQRVCDMCLVLADALGFGPEEMDQIMFAATLHDVGKIGVPESILLKSGPLDKEEFERIRLHPVEGERMLKHISFLTKAASVIRHHHERWDGKGYPDGLRGKDIELPARVMAIADSFDAMTTDRSYRQKLPHRQVMDELYKGKGTQFDPELVDLFVERVAHNYRAPSSAS
jgi:response regulator RpfG family c-di-GMP phosphodiesterase